MDWMVPTKQTYNSQDKYKKLKIYTKKPKTKPNKANLTFAMKQIGSILQKRQLTEPTLFQTPPLWTCTNFKCYHSTIYTAFLPHSVNLVHHVTAITSSQFHSRLKTHLFTNPWQILSYQLDCLHGLRTTLRYVLVLPLSSFSWCMCRTKLDFS